MIKVFNSTDKLFASNGDVVLRPIKAKVHKVDNGDYYLDLETGLEHVDFLVEGNIIIANTPQGNQAFRITNPQKTRSKITIKAWHVFFDSKNYLIADSFAENKTCDQALNHFNDATEPQSEFTVSSDVTTVDSYRCVRESLYTAVMTVLDRWGGHLVRNNFDIQIKDSITQDNGITVQYKKNLREITVEENWDDVLTKILPVGKDGILLNEVNPSASIYITSSTQYDLPYTKTVSFEQDINEEDYQTETEYKTALVNDLRTKATSYLNENCVPKVNYTLKANLEKVTDIGDIIHVKDERININLMTSVISYEYDCMLEKFTEIEFGNFKPTLSGLIPSITNITSSTIMENVEGKLAEKQNLLVSGTNIKTINSQSLLGSGNLSIVAGVSDVEVNGTSVVTGGVAEVTVPTITDTYSGTSSDGMSGKAVKSAIDALDGTVSGSPGAGKALTAFSQTDGKVSATFGDISITKSQVSDFPSIPTKTSDLSNDSNFVSDANYVHTDNNFTNADETKLSGIEAGAEVNVQSDWDEADSTSDAYIQNKPTIPTVNNGTLTIQKNGSNVQTFSANQSGNATANITVPTALSDLSDDSTHRVVTDTQISSWNGKSNFSGDYDDLTNKPTIPTKTSDLNNDSGFITSADIPSASSANPAMDGTASPGSSTAWSRGDHVHPTDTSRQETLVSGTNIKTINNQSLLGSGNITIQGGGGGGVTDVEVDGTSVVSGGVAEIDLTGKQDTLVSGTNIKTINSQSLLGSGNITINTEDEIFLCVYGSTSYADALSAYNDGKILMCDDSTGLLLLFKKTSSTFEFVRISNDWCVKCILSNSSPEWSIITDSIPSASDYVVEQGESGNWQYTKWNSGKLEQYYVGNPGSYTIGTTRGQLRSGGNINYAFPIAFVSDPSVVVGATLTTDAYVVWAQESSHSLTSITVRIVSSANISANSNYAIHIHAVGKWK